jgi:lysozyme
MAGKRKRKQWDKRRRIVAAVLLLLLFAVSIPFAIQFLRGRSKLFHTFDSNTFSDKYIVRGVDISHHNSFIDWNRLREGNISFVYMKSTEGASHNDRDYRKNYRLAKEAGLKVGTYHFYTFGMDGEGQAQHFIRGANVQSQDLVPAIDVEHSTVNIFSRDKEFAKRTIGELKRLEQVLYDYFGVHPVLYTNKECYKMYIKGNFPENPVWICDLHAEPSDGIDNWVIWQFSHTGKIDGVADAVDLNYYRYSFAEFQKMLMP